jgi:hypothetical protein
VTLAVSGLPQGATATFSPQTLGATGTSSLTVSVGAASPVGTYPLTITASNGSIAPTTMAFLTIVAPSPANMISPATGSNLSAGPTTFAWDSGMGVSQFQLVLGSTPGGSDLFTGSAGTSQSATVTLPASSQQAHAALSSQIASSQQAYASLNSLVAGAWQTQTYSYTLNATAAVIVANSVIGTSSGGGYGVDNDGKAAKYPFCISTSNACVNNNYNAANTSNCEVLQPIGLQSNGQEGAILDKFVSALIVATGTQSSLHQANDLDIIFVAGPGAPEGGRDLVCTYAGQELSLQNAITVYDGPPQIFYPPTLYPPAYPGGPFYATILGTRFGPKPGLVSAGVLTQTGACCAATGDLGVTQVNPDGSAPAGAPYAYWSDSQINVLLTPTPTASGLYQLLVTASYGESGLAFQANRADIPSPESNPGLLTVPLAPLVTITGSQGIAQGGSDTFSVTVSGSMIDWSSITLTLGTSPGTTGSATFANGTTSMTITGTQNVIVNGVLASSTANNITISAYIDSEPLASQQFSVVSVSIKLNAKPGTGSTGDSAWVNFSKGVSTLGSTISNFPGSVPVCAAAVELVGTVAPSNYAGLITLRRSKNAYAYQGTQLYSGYPESGDDTSQEPSLDTNPQSTVQGAVQGTVYDLDAPGIAAPNKVVDGAGSPDWYTHYRSNFIEYAILGDYDSAMLEKDGSSPKNASGSFTWYAATSCTFDPNTGDTLISHTFDPAGDNQAGKGTTLTTYNLQPPQQ